MDTINLTNITKEILQIISESQKEYATYVVETNDYIYFGEALVGANIDNAVWKISRTTKTSPFITTWASGDSLYTHKMSDYLSIIFI